MGKRFLVSGISLLIMAGPMAHSQDEIADLIVQNLPPVETEETATPEELSGCIAMTEALAVALDKDPRIDGAYAQRDIARANLLAARSRNRPQVSLFGQTGFGDTPPLDRRRDDQVGVQLEQELYSFGARKMATQAAALRYRASVYGVDQSTAQVAEQVALAFLDYARARNVIDLIREKTEAFRQEAETAESRLKRRVMTLTDASQIRARYAGSRSELIDAEVAADLALSRLEVLTGKKISCISEPSIRAFVAPEEPRLMALSPESAVDEARANSATIQQVRAQVTAARASYGEAQRANMPVVNLTAFAQAFEENTSDIFGNTDTDYDQDSRVGISVSQNLYAGGRIRAQKLDALARLRQARADEDLQLLALDDQIRRALAQARARKEAGIVLLEASDQARIQFDFTKREYDRGTKTLTDLVLASDTYFSAASREIDARYGFYSSLISLYSAMGLLSEDGLR